MIVSALVLTIAASLSACKAPKLTNDEGKTATQGETKQEQTQQKGELKTVKFAIPEPDLKYMQPIFDNYNDSQSEYVIEPISIVSGPDMYTKLTMMMQSPKTCPDVIAEDGFMINSDVAAGRLMSLDDALADWSDLNNFIPSVLEGGKAEDGKLYGLPKTTDTQGIYYNKKLLEKAGIATPWQPKDWAEIIEVGKKLKETNADVEDFIPMFLYAAKNTPEETSMRTFQVLYSGTGGSLYDYNEKKWVIDSEKLLKVFNFVNDVYNVEKIGSTPAFAGQNQVGSTITSEYMRTDKIGLLFTGNWVMANFAPEGSYPFPKAEEVWGYASTPTWDGGGNKYTTMSGGWAWSIPNNANEKEGAIEVLKMLGSKDTTLKVLIATGDLTPRKDLADNPEYIERPFSVAKDATAQLDFTHFRPSVDGYSSLSTMFTDTIESIVVGSATPEQALENFKTAMIRTVGTDRVIEK